MQVNVTNTNGILQALQQQRNDALNEAARMGGTIAELKAALDAANKRIKEFEEAAAKEDAKKVHEQEQDAA